MQASENEKKTAAFPTACRKEFLCRSKKIDSYTPRRLFLFLWYWSSKKKLQKPALCKQRGAKKLTEIGA